MQKDVVMGKIQESEEKSKIALIVAVMTFVLVVVMFFWVRNETLKRVENLEAQAVSIIKTIDSLAYEMRGKYALVQTRMNVLETTQKQQGERLAKVEDKIKRYSDAEAKRLKNEILGELETLKVLGVDKAKIETIKKLLQK